MPRRFKDPHEPTPFRDLPAAALRASIREGYRRPDLKADVMAGLVVGIVALPLSMALAIAIGAPPQHGLYTAIVGGFIVAILGGSRVQIGGPTGAYVVIVAGIVERYGVDGLIVCTLIAGVLLLGMGLLRLGAVIKFIPYPLTVGFTAGIAVVIFSSQIRDLLGLEMVTVPTDFVEKWKAYALAASTADVTTSATTIRPNCL